MRRCLGLRQYNCKKKGAKVRRSTEEKEDLAAGIVLSVTMLMLLMMGIGLVVFATT